MIAVRLAVSWNSSLNLAHKHEQCTYLGYVLLEAPRGYVLHGPLLSIHWLRLCPHLGGPHPKPRHLEEVVYSLNDSRSHFTQGLSPPKVPQQHTETIPMVHNNIIHTYYTSHSYAHLHLLFLHVLFKTSLLRIFMAGWLPSAPCVRYKQAFHRCGRTTPQLSQGTPRLSFSSAQYIVHVPQKMTVLRYRLNL